MLSALVSSLGVQEVVIGAAIGLVVLGFAIHVWQEKRRREAYEQFGLLRGFHYEAKPSEPAHDFAALADVFNRGHSRKRQHELRGQLGNRPFTAFEYRYTTGGGKNSQTHVFGVLHWELADVDLPRFSVAPEGFFDRIGQLFGAQDIDFPDDPTFSRAYQLKAADEAAARALFTPAVRAFLVATPKQYVAGAGPHLLWWRPGRLAKPEALDQFLAEGFSVRRVFVKD